MGPFLLFLPLNILPLLSPSLVTFGVCGAPSAVSTPTPGSVTLLPHGVGARLLTGSAAEMWKEALRRDPLMAKSPSPPAATYPHPTPLPRTTIFLHPAMLPPGHWSLSPAPAVMPSPDKVKTTVSSGPFPAAVKLTITALTLNRNKTKKPSLNLTSPPAAPFLCSTLQCNYWKERPPLAVSSSSPPLAL